MFDFDLAEDLSGPPNKQKRSSSMRVLAQAFEEKDVRDDTGRTS